MNIKDVENLAELARIELDENEKRDLLRDMEDILDYVKQIERSSAEIDENEAVPNGTGSTTGNIGTGTHNVWREDKIEPREFSHELIIEQFPDAQDGFLKVKKIL